MSKQSNVKVYCGVRPENEKEKQSKTPIYIFPMNENTIKICSSSPDQHQETKTHEFSFDSIFPQNSTQNDIFTKCALPLIKSVLEGINRNYFVMVKFQVVKLIQWKDLIIIKIYMILFQEQHNIFLNKFQMQVKK